MDPNPLSNASVCKTEGRDKSGSSATVGTQHLSFLSGQKAACTSSSIWCSHFKEVSHLNSGDTQKNSYKPLMVASHPAPESVAPALWSWVSDGPQLLLSYQFGDAPAPGPSGSQNTVLPSVQLHTLLGLLIISPISRISGGSFECCKCYCQTLL